MKKIINISVIIFALLGLFSLLCGLFIFKNYYNECIIISILSIFIMIFLTPSDGEQK